MFEKIKPAGKAGTFLRRVNENCSTHLVLRKPPLLKHAKQARNSARSGANCPIDLLNPR